jgi:hypothetical protein
LVLHWTWRSSLSSTEHTADQDKTPRLLDTTWPSPCASLLILVKRYGTFSVHVLNCGAVCTSSTLFLSVMRFPFCFALSPSQSYWLQVKRSICALSTIIRIIWDMRIYAGKGKSKTATMGNE